MKFRSKNQKKRLPSSKLPSARQDNLHLKRSGRYVSPHRKNPKGILGTIVKKLVLPFTISFLFIEKRITEPIAHQLDEWDLFRILEKIGFLIAIVVFIVEFSDRKEQRIFEAWQVVQDGKESKTGVLRLALERLIKEGFGLKGINASNTFLRGIKLIRADLSDANFSGADFIKADLRYSFFKNTNLSRADFKEAKLNDANLNDANLSGADLFGSNLSGADLNGADLTNTNFSGADLSGADLSGEKINIYYWGIPQITPKQIKQAKNWEKAVYSPQFRKKLGLPPLEE